MKCQNPACGYDKHEEDAIVCNLCGDLLNKNSTSEATKRALVCNSFAPIFLQPNTQLTLGRSPNNTIALQSDLLSRCHLSIMVDSQENVSVQDEGSRNGSLVNGSRIHERTLLKFGDKITVGSYHIFYKEIAENLVQNDPNEFHDDATIAVSELGESDGMVGNLAHLNLTEIFSTLQFNEKTGILSLHNKEEAAKIYFKNGNILRCELGSLLNLEAISKAFESFTDGAFEFSPQPIDFPGEIALTTVQILLEYARNNDEKSKPQYP